MSHSHTHAPGEEHSHSHGPQQPQQMMPAPDPALQALIDQDFRPVPLALGADGAIAVCEPHKLEKCDNCNVDFVNTNRLSRLLVANPNLLCPPPSNIVSQKLTQMVTGAKDEGNVSIAPTSSIVKLTDMSAVTFQKWAGATSRAALYNRCHACYSTTSMGSQPVHARRVVNYSVQSFRSVF